MVLALELALYRLFAKNQLPATEVCKVFQAAWEDGWGWKDGALACRLRDSEAEDDALAIVRMGWALDSWGGSTSAQRLSQCGGNCQSNKNIARDLFRVALSTGLVVGLPHTYKFTAPGPDGEERQHTMYLPHETLHSETNKTGGSYLLPSERDGPLGNLVREWCEHPDVQVTTPEAVQIVGLHGDGVQYTTSIRAGGGGADPLSPST